MFIGRFKQRLTISKLRPKELLIPSSNNDVCLHFWGYVEKMKHFLVFFKVSHSDFNQGH